MDIRDYYKPSFTTDEIKTVNNIFGYEFFKMLKDEVNEKGCNGEFPESGERKRTKEKEN